MTWTPETNPFGDNRTPLLIGLSSIDGETVVPVAVDPATGAVLTEGGSVASSVNATVYQGTNPWTVSGTVSIGAGGSGVTTVYQGGAPWLVNASVQGIINGIVTIANPSAAEGVTTVFQGGAPWLVSASVGTPTINQGTSPWVVDATLYGVINANVSLQGVANVNASIQGIINGIVTIANPSASGGVTTVYQGGAPWLVNASIIGTPNTNISSVSPLTATGAIQLLNSAIALNVEGYGVAGIQITGTALVGTAVFEGTVDGTDWVSIQAWPVAGGLAVTSTQSIGVWTTPIGGLQQIRVRVSTAFTDSLNVYLQANIDGIPISSDITAIIAPGATVSAEQIGPWNVTATIGNTINALATVFQGGAPWLVNASVVGQQAVTVTIASPLPVSATYAGPWNVVASQGATPWLVNASVIGILNVNATTPNAIVAADGMANPTSPEVLGFNMIYDGATWERMRGDIGDASAATGLLVNNSLLYNSSTYDRQRSVQAVIATEGTGLGIQASGMIGMYAAVLQTIASTATLAYYPAQLDINGNQKVVLQSVATVIQGTSPWLVNASVVGVQNVNASIIGVQNVIATVLQGISPWLVNASVVGQQAVTATYAAPWAVVASQYANLPQIMASVSNSAVLTGAVEMSAYNPVTISIVSSATYAYAPNFTDINAQDLVTPGASASSIGTSIYNITALLNTVTTVKSSGGTANLYGYHIYNPNSSVTYVPLYAQTLATIGLTAPTAVLVVPAGGWADANPNVPIAFASGLIVGASASVNGTGKPTTGLIANFWYR